MIPNLVESTTHPLVRLLIIEDQQRDAELIARHLRREGLEISFERIESAAALRQSLRSAKWDLILCDYVMPGFSALAALEIVKDSGQDMPFIIVSGAVGEDAAVEAMRAGAHDYVMKDNLRRLVPAVLREVNEARSREARRQAESCLENAGRAVVLSEVSHALASTLNLHEMYERLSKLIVPKLSDWYILDLGRKDSKVECVAVAHGKPAKAPLADALKSLPSEPFHPCRRVISTGQTEHSRDLQGELDSLRISNVEQHQLIVGLGAASLVSAPLRARGAVIGCITFLRGSSSLAFQDSDLELCTELGIRIGLAIDNARLHQEAQEAILLRDQFLSIASHELKTPLTSMKLQLQLARRVATKLNSDVVEFGTVSKALDVSVRQVENLTGLINELLDVAKIRAGSLTFRSENVDLAELVREVCERYADELTKAKCHLQCELESGVRGYWDRLKLEQVVTNLLSNAAKYAPGKPVQVSVKRKASHAVLRIQDFGPGIPRDKQTKVFDRFERAVSSNSVSGLGLGLFIVNEIVKAHHGTICLESDGNLGCTFTLELPHDSREQAISV